MTEAPVAKPKRTITKEQLEKMQAGLAKRRELDRQQKLAGTYKTKKQLIVEQQTPVPVIPNEDAIRLLLIKALTK
jgi:hypothetical protein